MRTLRSQIRRWRRSSSERASHGDLGLTADHEPRMLTRAPGRSGPRPARRTRSCGRRRRRACPQTSVLPREQGKLARSRRRDRPRRSRGPGGSGPARRRGGPRRRWRRADPRSRSRRRPSRFGVRRGVQERREPGGARSASGRSGRERRQPGLAERRVVEVDRQAQQDLRGDRRARRGSRRRRCCACASGSPRGRRR